MTKITNKLTNRYTRIEAILEELTYLEEFMLVFLIKKTDILIKDIDEFYELINKITIYKHIFIKLLFIYTQHMCCHITENTNFFNKEENILLLKIYNYHINHLDINTIKTRHANLSYLYFLHNKLEDTYNNLLSNNSITTTDIHDFIYDMYSNFNVQFRDLDLKTITPQNMHKYLNDLLIETQSNTIATGYCELDQIINGGMKAGDMIIIAAQPGNGKTMLCLNILNNNIQYLKVTEQSAIYFCPDMHIRYIYKRLWSIYTKKTQYELQYTEFNKIINTLQEIPIIISEESNLENIIRIIKYYVKQVKIVFIDYIQLITSTKFVSYNKNEQIAKILIEFKKIIRENNILLILISQLNREASLYEVNISQLKDSSALEQDADLILLLTAKQRKLTHGDIELNMIVGKNRHGKQNVRFHLTMDKDNFMITEKNVSQEKNTTTGH